MIPGTLHFAGDFGGHQVGVTLDLSVAQAWWGRLAERAHRLRAADAGGVHPDATVARAACGCGAGPTAVLNDGLLRTCTGCGTTFA